MKKTLIILAIFLYPYVFFGQETDSIDHNSKPFYSHIVEEHKDYYVFRSSKRTIQLDTHQFLQPGYIIHLPKKIKDIFQTSTNCIVDIGRKQTLYINSNFQNRGTRPDSVYIPSLEEIDRIVQRFAGDWEFWITEDNALMVDNWYENDQRPQNNRRDLIISREGIVILMLNIKRSRFDKLYELLNNSLIVDY